MRLYANIVDGKVKYSELRDRFGFVCWCFKISSNGFYKLIVETFFDISNSITNKYTYRFVSGKKTLISKYSETVSGDIEENYNINGIIVNRVCRNRHGLVHNIGSPAYQEWYDNGLRKLEIYYTMNRKNNPIGPAVSKWKETGYLLRHKYYSHGNRIHRDILVDRMKKNFRRNKYE
jgi:hypothetical protein